MPWCTILCTPQTFPAKLSTSQLLPLSRASSPPLSLQGLFATSLQFALSLSLKSRKVIQVCTIMFSCFSVAAGAIWCGEFEEMRLHIPFYCAIILFYGLHRCTTPPNRSVYNPLSDRLEAMVLLQAVMRVKK